MVLLNSSSDVIPALSAAARTTTNAGSRSRGRTRVRCCDCPRVSQWLLRYRADSRAYVVATCSWHGVIRAGNVDRLVALGSGERGAL